MHWEWGKDLCDMSLEECGLEKQRPDCIDRMSVKGLGTYHHKEASRSQVALNHAEEQSIQAQHQHITSTATPTTP